MRTGELGGRGTGRPMAGSGRARAGRERRRVVWTVSALAILLFALVTGAQSAALPAAEPPAGDPPPAELQAAGVPAAGSQPLMVPVDPEPLALGLHLGSEPLSASASLPIAAALGATVVPIDFEWERVQPAPERFEWEDYDFAVRRARSLQLQPVGVLVYPAEMEWTGEGGRPVSWPTARQSDWLFFVDQVIARFGWAISEWVVAREEPLDADPLLWAREAVPHARFVQETAAVIRRGLPGARVRVAASGMDLLWLEVFAREGGLDGVDGLVLDVNRWPAPPDGLPVVIHDVRGILRELGHDPELWVWRFGYPTHEGLSRTPPHRRGVSREQQADYLVRSHVLLAQAGIRLVLYQELMDGGWERDAAENSFGLLQRDGELKPAARAYQTLARQLGGRHYGLPPVSTGNSDDATVQAMGALLAALRAWLGGAETWREGQPRVAVHPFAGAPDDGLVLVLWTPEGGAAGTPQTVPRVRLEELALPAWVQVRVTDGQGVLLDHIPLGPAPVYVEVVAVAEPAPPVDPLDGEGVAD